MSLTLLMAIALRGPNYLTTDTRSASPDSSTDQPEEGRVRHQSAEADHGERVHADQPRQARNARTPSLEADPTSTAASMNKGRSTDPGQPGIHVAAALSGVTDRRAPEAECRHDTHRFDERRDERWLEDGDEGEDAQERHRPRDNGTRRRDRAKIGLRPGKAGERHRRRRRRCETAEKPRQQDPEIRSPKPDRRVANKGQAGDEDHRPPDRVWIECRARPVSLIRQERQDEERDQRQLEQGLEFELDTRINLAVFTGV
jgi:hypothetical protein